MWKLSILLGNTWYYGRYVPVVIALLMVGFLIGSNIGAEIFGTNYVVDMEAPETDKTMNDVSIFLWYDQTDKNEHLGDDIYDCENFSHDLVDNALKEGFTVAYVVIPTEKYLDNGKKIYHAIVAFNTTDRGVVFIEPQNDLFTYPDEFYSVEWYSSEIIENRKP